MDLGLKPKKDKPGSPIGIIEPKISYPRFDIRDAVCEKFLKDNPCKVGDELTGVVDLVVTGIRDGEYGKSVTLEVKDLEVQSHADEDDEEEPDEEEKTLGFKRPENKKEAPSMSAKDLED